MSSPNLSPANPTAPASADQSKSAVDSPKVGTEKPEAPKPGVAPKVEAPKPGVAPKVEAPKPGVAAAKTETPKPGEVSKTEVLKSGSGETTKTETPKSGEAATAAKTEVSKPAEAKTEVLAEAAGPKTGESAKKLPTLTAEILRTKYAEEPVPPKLTKGVKWQKVEGWTDVPLQEKHLDMSHILYPVKTENVKGSNVGVKSFRVVKFPFHWLINKAMGSSEIDEVKIMARYLPVFYVIPKQSEADVMPYVKKHVIKLRDGRKIVALKDMMNCRDSWTWFKKERSKIIANNLIVLKYTKKLIEEMQDDSALLFGRFLKGKWDSGKAKAKEEIEYQQKVRP